MDQPSEGQIQTELVRSPEAQRRLRRVAMRRASIGVGLVAALGAFLSWLPQSSRRLLVVSLVQNQLLIILLVLFGLIAVSLLWSKGQRLDVWLFKALNLRGYHEIWMDRAMWVSTQLGNPAFLTTLVVASYLLGDHRFAYALTLGSLTLWLVVTIIKALTDRARPFNLLRETRVIGWRAQGLSFPSGHAAQTFFIATLAAIHFELSLGVAAILYGLALLVGFSRVYLGMHYPRDVAAGAILALIWGSIGVMIAPYL